MAVENLSLEAVTSELCLGWCVVGMLQLVSCCVSRSPLSQGYPSLREQLALAAPCRRVEDEIRIIILISITLLYHLFLVKVGILLLENYGIYWMLLLKARLKLHKPKSYTVVCADLCADFRRNFCYKTIEPTWLQCFLCFSLICSHVGAHVQ